tara:strand:+ start:1315 stop:3213 length:1899 start_codon:yes stop_codon:yes gene_type:complete
MCGICGIVDLDNSPPVTREELSAMCKTIEHRGPDGTRQMIRNSVAFGHTRLSVIDKETGWQPISNEDGSVFVILNGEIYNFAVLRTELIRSGHKFSTASDTEVIVHAYEQYGLKFVEHLDGMFALAIWDQARKRLVLARDRFGKKPLFYAQSANRLSFASEAKTLLVARDNYREVNPLALCSYLTYGYVPEPMSIFDGILKLPPANLLVFDDSGLTIQQYWELTPTTDSSITPHEAAFETRRLMDKAIASRLISDVPLGFFLSGGLDSSIIVGSAARSTSSQLKTFSIGFEEDSFSELEYARLIAKKFDTDHQEFIVTANNLDDLEMIIRFADEPFADSSMIPMYYLARKTREHVTVALSGDGGDEIFGGYDRYIGLGLARRYQRVPKFIRSGLLSPLLGMIRESPEKRNNLRRLKRLVHPPFDSAEQLYMRWMQQFIVQSHERAFTSDFKANIQTNGVWNDHMAIAFRRFDNPTLVKSAQWVDLTTYLPGDLMVKTDRMSMAHGLEVRSPFLDHHLAEFAERIPAEQSIKSMSGKQTLKRAYSDLIPEEISKRPKSGFTMPIKEWINGQMKDFTHELIMAGDSEVSKVINRGFISGMLEQHHTRKHDHSARIWNLICLEIWAKTFKVSLTP